MLAALQGNFYPEYDIPLIIFYLLIITLGLANWFIVYCLLRVPGLRTMPFNVLVAAMAVVNGLSCSLTAPMDLHDVITTYSTVSVPWCHAKVGVRAFCFNVIKFLMLAAAFTRLVIGCFSKPVTVRYSVMILVSVVGFIVGTLGAVNNTRSTASPLNICLGRLMLTGADWSFYLIVSVSLYVATLICYLLLAVVLKLRACLKRTQTLSHNLNDTVVLLSYKSAIGVTIIYSISFLSPFISRIVRAADGIPDLRYMLHYMACYTALVYIQAAVTPLAFIATNKILKKHLRIIQRKVFLKSSVAPSSVTT